MTLFALYWLGVLHVLDRGTSVKNDRVDVLTALTWPLGITLYILTILIRGAR